MDKKKMFKYCFGCDPGIIPENVIVTPFLSPDRFADKKEVKDSFKGRLYSGIVAERNGKEYAVIRCGLGDRLLGDAVILFGQTNAHKLVFVGSCGGFADCAIGDLVICEAAFDGEGFSKYYVSGYDIERMICDGRDTLPDLDQTLGLREFLARKVSKDNEAKTGKIFTIGSLMAEEETTLALISNKGFIGIDMELSAVYAAAHASGLKAAGLLVVSDLPIDKPLWEELLPEEKAIFKNSTEEAMKLAVEFITS